jgi:hypothetical protein
MRKLTLLMVVGLLCFSAPIALSQDILVVDKDHNKTFPDPEGAGNVDATYGVTKALDDCGYAYTKVDNFPGDISRFDIMFIIMGTYC